MFLVRKILYIAVRYVRNAVCFVYNAVRYTHNAVRYTHNAVRYEVFCAEILFFQRGGIDFGAKFL